LVFDASLLLLIKKEKQIVLVKRQIGMLKNKLIILSKSADLFSGLKWDVA
jgi:hypothetical protein